jgi:hypothetical protein
LYRGLVLLWIFLGRYLSMHAWQAGSFTYVYMCVLVVYYIYTPTLGSLAAVFAWVKEQGRLNQVHEGA